MKFKLGKYYCLSNVILFDSIPPSIAKAFKDKKSLKILEIYDRKNNCFVKELEERTYIVLTIEGIPGGIWRYRVSNFVEKNEQLELQF